MDAATGKMLNDFSGHTVISYRCRSCFGLGEASVTCGDEKGHVWAWDLLDVSIVGGISLQTLIDYSSLKANPLQPSPPPRVRDKVITWVEHHPSEDGEMITASADGTVRVWQQAT